jgi:hypothetical protein
MGYTKIRILVILVGNIGFFNTFIEQIFDP